MKYSLMLFCLAYVPAALGAEMLRVSDFQAEKGAPNMQTNIALIGSKAKLGDLGDKLNVAIVDPTSALEDSANNNLNGDIQEDPRDPFITSKTGKLRPNLIENGDEWANEELVVDSRRQYGGEQKTLSRKKRCNDNDGDGDARRARRARRNRARSARRARARAAKRAARANSSTTTVVRKVIQNGQVVSQTTETQGSAPVITQPRQVVVQHQPAVVKTVQPIQPAQPVAVAVAQPDAAAAASVSAMPSIAVTGSVKVN